MMSFIGAIFIAQRHKKSSPLMELSLGLSKFQVVVLAIRFRNNRG